MKKKIIICLVILMTICGVASARTKVADFGDVRIYSHGGGYFEVESDRVQQCFSLTFREKSGWIEVACSNVVRKAGVGGIEEAVNWVVTTYLGGNKFAGRVAGTVAAWAADVGWSYLCN